MDRLRLAENASKNVIISAQNERICGITYKTQTRFFPVRHISLTLKRKVSNVVRQMRQVASHGTSANGPWAICPAFQPAGSGKPYRGASSPDVIKAMKVVQHSSPLITARYLENSETELDHLVLGSAASPTPDGPAATLHQCVHRQLEA